MKIYEIGTGYTPIPAQVAAATESVVEELTKAFMDLGQDVEILDVSSTSRASHNLPITEVYVPSIITKADVSLGIIHKVKRVSYSVALAAKLKKILQRAEDKVVLHFHNQYNMFFFLKIVPEGLRKRSVIAYTNHNGFWSLPWEEAEETIRKRYFQEIESMKCADVVFVLNHKMKENVVQHLGIPEERVIPIHNGVNTDIYTPLSDDEIQRCKNSLSLGGKKVILQVGSVNENKGQSRSLELLAPMLKKDQSLVFAYAGGIVSEEYHQKVKQRAEDLGVSDQVVYLGMVSPGPEMNRLYNIANATIFASKFEGFPLVCIESLAAGIPVSLFSNMPMNFGEGCIALQKESAEDVFNTFLHNEGNLGEWKRMARENAVNHFTWVRIAEEYVQAIRDVCKLGVEDVL